MSQAIDQPKEDDLHPSKRMRAETWWGVAVGIITLSVFAPSIPHDFANFDDDIHVWANPYLWPVDSSNLAHFWTAPYEKLYIPVSYNVYQLIGLVARLPAPNSSLTETHALFNPILFHAVSVILHTVNALLVYKLLRNLLGSDQKPWAAGIGALIFALHPLQVESVAWISEIRGVLCWLFTLLALNVYCSTSAKLDLKSAMSMTALTAFAVLSKPSAACVPLVAAALGAMVQRMSWRDAILKAMPMFVVAGIYVIATAYVQTVSDASRVPVWQRFFVAGDALSFYLAKLLDPHPLGLDYGRTPQSIMGHSWGYVTWLFPAAIAALIALFSKRIPWLAGGGLVSIASLLPVLGFVPFVFQDTSTVADRYVYLAMIGPAILVAFALRDARKPQSAIWVSLAILVLCAVLTVKQETVWANGESLMRNTISVNPSSVIGHTALGNALYAQSDYAAAIREYDAALAFNPKYFDALNDKGNALFQTGQYDQAAQCYVKANDDDRSRVEAYVGLANVLIKLGRVDLAKQQLDTALKIDPELPAVHISLGVALAGEGNLRGARDQFNIALHIDPYNAEARRDLEVLNGMAR